MPINIEYNDEVMTVEDIQFRYSLRYLLVLIVTILISFTIGYFVGNHDGKKPTRPPHQTETSGSWIPVNTSGRKKG